MMSENPTIAANGEAAVPNLEDVRSAMKEILVDVLAVEPAEVVPDAEFFDDLHGESIDVLETTFRLQSRYGRSFELGRQFSRDVEVSPEGVVTSAYLGRLSAEYPFLPMRKLPDSPKVDSLRKLLTVETLVQLVYTQLKTPMVGMVGAPNAPTMATA